MKAILQRWQAILFWTLGYRATANRKDRRGQWWIR